MSLKQRAILFMALMLIALPAATRLTAAQSLDEEYFTETGHIVRGEFLEKYRSADDPVLVYGFPITEAFHDQLSNRIIQYFQRARFEFHPNEPEGQRVKISPLGKYLYEPGDELPIPGSNPACREFPETGHRVCYAFLEFYEKNGGQEQFGLPISSFESHEGRIVQYFENARFEWRPDFPPGQRVVLTDLGTRYFYIREDPRRRDPVVSDNLVPTITELKVQAFTDRAVLGMQDEQTISVIVRDQNQRPVPDAQVSIVVRPPRSAEGQYITGLTDQNGVVRYTFPYKAGAVGLAEIAVTARYQDLQGETQTSFLIWW